VKLDVSAFRSTLGGSEIPVLSESYIHHVVRSIARSPKLPSISARWFSAPMRYRLLGKSGLRVSELCLGTMTFGEEWGFGANADETRRMYRAFVDRGGNFLDTANIYTKGTSEQLVGELMASHRAKMVVATKYAMSTDPSDPNANGAHRKNLVQSLEASLKRLRTDYVDLLWIHAWDATTPTEELMRALDDVVRAGKVLYLGISNTPAWTIARASTIAELRGWTPFVGMQIEYSLIQRSAERELLPMAKALDIAVTAWATLGGGVLSGKYRGPQADDSKRVAMNQRRTTERNLAIAEVVKQVASEVERSPAQVAIAWAIQQGPNVIPILGARTAAQLEDNLNAAGLVLSAEQLAKLDAASAIDLGYPMDFLERALPSLYGDNVDRIVDHRRRQR
jgi:aryl-alcohol dehydrogenase-like predicted oxidoreductase